MNILIKEKECTYLSDFPEGWKFSSGDYFKFPVNIKTNPPFEGEYPCFIKRFEKKDPASISGWELLVKLEHRFEPNLARVHDIASVEEKGRRVYYVVYEYLEGNTLEKLVAGNMPVDLLRLTNDLFLALASLQKYGYWFADFVEKNILVESNGRSVLMDLDSAQPFAKFPHDDMDVSKDYWVLVFDYYKNILGYGDLKVSDLSGLSFNQLQVMFLILRLRLSYDPGQQQYRHAETFQELPAALDRIDPAIRELFVKVYNDRANPQYAEQADEIKKMIIQKIIPYQSTPPVPAEPVIEAFTVDLVIVEKGHPFELKWKVSNATSLELYKNGVFDSRFSPQERGITKTAFYDGTTTTVSYKLVVSKGEKQVESKPVSIQVRDKFAKPAPPPDPAPVPPPPPPPPPIYIGFNEIIKRYIKGIVIGLAALFAVLIFFLIKWWPSRVSEKPVVSSVNPRVDAVSPVIINGKNFPADSNTIRVFINRLPVTIQSHSENRLAVDYPAALHLFHQKETDRTNMIIDTVDLVIDNDTIHAQLRVLRNLTFPEQNTGSEEEQIPDEPDTQGPPGTLSSREQRIIDSIGLIQSLRSKQERSGIRDPRKAEKERAEQRIIDSIRAVSAQRR